MSVLDPRYERLRRAELEQFQLERLQGLLARLRRNVRRVREKLGDARVESLADIARLPFTTPAELAESFPYGMFAFPLREVIRLFSMAGPDGRPVVVGHTRNDLLQWGRLVARQLAAAGVTANDVIQVCLGGSAGSGTAGYLLGSELLEASVMAEDPLHIDYQLAVLENYRPTFLITTPTTAFELMQAIEARRMDPQSLHLRTVLLSRPVPAEAREQLSAGLFARVHCNFGVGEILDPGLTVECENGRLHVNEDQFIAEICDGELVVTTLAREALPLLRYRTRLRAELNADKCACGRSGATLKVGERLDGQYRVREVIFYRQQIETILNRTHAAGQPFELDAGEDRVVISVEMSENLFANAARYFADPKRELESELFSRLGLATEIRFTEPKSVDR